MKDEVIFGIGLLSGILFRFGLFTLYTYLAIKTLQYFGVAI